MGLQFFALYIFLICKNTLYMLVNGCYFNICLFNAIILCFDIGFWSYILKKT